MSTVKFISDPHISHEKMAEWIGFKSIEEHDEHIISSIQNNVVKRDLLYILGDLTMEKENYKWLDRIECNKKVILGNHDLGKHVPKLLQHVNEVSSVKYLRKYKIILTHIPIHESELDRFKLNIHGHVHVNTLSDKRYLNVCCEILNYKPISLDEVLQIL